MTSHSIAPDGLPYVVPGSIWDGFTEYHDERPPGVSGIFLLRMYGDGSRRFSEYLGTGTPMYQFRARTVLGWEQIGVTFDRPSYLPHGGDIVDYRNSGFLGYDGSLTFDPVNQFIHLNPFKEHAARFAHQLDAAMGHHTLASADERDRMTVHRALSAMIGSAAKRYATWEAIDPEELVIGGVYDGTPLWKRTEEDNIAVDMGLCGQCDIATFARRFLLNADLAEFRRRWRQGIVYAADRTMTPWAPTLFDVAQGTNEDFYDELDDYYARMLTHYDHVIGPAEHR